MTQFKYINESINKNIHFIPIFNLRIDSFSTISNSKNHCCLKQYHVHKSQNYQISKYCHMTAYEVFSKTLLISSRKTKTGNNCLVMYFPTHFVPLNSCSNMAPITWQKRFSQYYSCSNMATTTWQKKIFIVPFMFQDGHQNFATTKKYFHNTLYGKFIRIPAQTT